VKFSTVMSGILPVRPYIFILTIFLSACGAHQIAETGTEQGDELSVSDRPKVNKAISMTVPHEAEKVYSVYGVELGESFQSVKDKYSFAFCQTSQLANESRCYLALDTRGVKGVSETDETNIIIIFDTRKNSVTKMVVLLPSMDLSKTTKLLHDIYGDPVSNHENKIRWSNASGSIILEESNEKAQPSLLNFTAN